MVGTFRYHSAGKMRKRKTRGFKSNLIGQGVLKAVRLDPAARLAVGEDFPERFRAAFRRADEHRRDNPNHLVRVIRLR